MPTGGSQWWPHAREAEMGVGGGECPPSWLYLLQLHAVEFTWAPKCQRPFQMWGRQWGVPPLMAGVTVT